MYIQTKKAMLSRPAAAVLIGALAMPTLSGCGGGNQTANIPPPVDATRGQAPTQPRATGGMSKTQKTMVVLAGAAAVYYLYKKRQNAQGQPTQYYRSKNGRIYYRDAKTKQAIWVTPETTRVQIPADEAEAYRSYRGYNNNPNGVDPTNQIPMMSGSQY